MSKEDLGQYLGNADFIDAGHQDVVDHAQSVIKTAQVDEADQIAVAVALYYAVRDGLRYDPHDINLTRKSMKASSILTRDRGFCIEKAILLAADARVYGIPSRLGFANVRNHIAAEKLAEILQTDVMVFHGYTELYLDGKWVKATPAFNKSLCRMLHVEPLGFNGHEDSVFQQYATGGNEFMEYLHDYGQFADLPYDLMINEWKKHYGHLIEKLFECMESP